MPISKKTEKPKDVKKVLFRLWKYLYMHKWPLAAAFILTVASNLLSVAAPKLSGNAIDAIGINKGEVDLEKVFYYCGLMIAFYVISAILSYILSRIMIFVSQKIIYQMRKDVFNKLMLLPVSFFDRHQAGDIISRISYDIDTVNSSLSSDLIQICTSVFTVAGSFIMMCTISVKLLSVFFVTIPIALFFTKYMTAKVKPYFKKRSAKLGELNGFVEEVITTQKTTKVYNREKEMIAAFDEKNEEAVDAYYKAEYYSCKVGPNVNFVNNLSLALISVFGSILYIKGNLRLGMLSSFVLYSRKFSGPINETANIISELQAACAAAERVFLLLDEPGEINRIYKTTVDERIYGDVDIENLNFSYTPGKQIIYDFNLNAPKGKMIAIVGHTGSGKTTIINLLMRFYDPESGNIKIDGKNVLNINKNAVRKSFAMVLQDTWLFYGSIYDNIVYGKKDATLEDVKRVCRSAKIDDYIESLPNGYDTILNENAMNLSQGQKQLLTIARAMLLDADMLILDEATSNVDTRTEMQIQQAMRTLMKDKTCFIIAHRLSTIETADNILVMDKGRIVQQGTHRELLKQKGLYSELYNAQFE